MAVALGRVVLSALGLQCVYTIAASFIALLYLYCLLWAFFASCFGGLAIDFGWLTCHNVEVLLLFL